MTVKSSSAGKELRHAFLLFWDSGRDFLEANELVPARCLAAVPKGLAGHIGLVLRVQGLRCLLMLPVPTPRPEDLAACGMSFPF